MIWIFVFGIIAIIFAIMFAREFDLLISKIFVGIISIPIFCAIGIIFGALVAMIMGIFGLFLPTEEVVVSERLIYSLSDSNGINGSFVLGTGKVDSDLYFYYVVDGENGKEIEKEKRENIIIVETYEETPYKKTTGERLKWKWLEWFMVDPNSLFDKTTLTVPNETILQEYNVDLE